MPRFTVIFSNSGGVVSRERTDTEQAVSRIVVDWAAATVFAGGDKIEIVDHEETGLPHPSER